MPENRQGFPQGPANPQQNAVATREHALIREWAARHGAEPATGEATPSGPATINVKDGRESSR